MKPIKRVVVTGGAGQIAYSLLFRIANGEMLGDDQPVALHLLEVPAAVETLNGVVMELIDCGFPLLKEIKVGSDPLDVFEGIDLALLVGAFPRGPGMERSDLLKTNAEIFVKQGKALDQVANKECRVLVVGNPCNTNCLIAMHNAPSLNRKNFHAMTRLDENRAKAQIAIKASVGVEDVSCMCIWGNHSATQVPDFVHAKIGKDLVCDRLDRAYLEGAFIEGVQKRGAKVIAARGRSSAASAANGVINAIQSLYRPTKEGDWFSSGVLSDGNPYGIEEGLVFSFPCRSKGDGHYEIVKGLEWDDFLKKKIAATEKELLEERAIALGM